MQNKLSIYDSNDFEKENNNYLKYNNIQVDIKDNIHNLCLSSIFQALLINLIPIMQLFYTGNIDTSVEKNIKLNLIIFGQCILIFHIFTFFIDYTSDKLIKTIFYLLFDKNYYEIGKTFRKTAIILVPISFILYLPGILIAHYLTTSTCIIQYLYINLITLVCLSFNKLLHSMIYTFQKNGIINMSCFLKFVVNLTLCKYFAQRYPDWYFINGIAWADAISEISVSILLTIYMHINNPYPQTWIDLNLNIFNLNELIIYALENVLILKEMISYILPNLSKEILVLIYIFLELEDDKYIFDFVFFILFNNLLFKSQICSQRKTIQNIQLYFWNIKKEQQSSKFIDNQNNNKELLLIIKKSVNGCILISFLAFLILSISYFLDIFSIFSVDKFSFFYILLISINGTANSLLNELFVINKQLYNMKLYSVIYIGYLTLSLSAFILIIILRLENIYTLLLSLCIAEFYVIYNLYKYILQFDVRVVILSQLMQL